MLKRLLLLLSIALYCGCNLYAYDFQIGNLLYSISYEDDTEVAVDMYVDIEKQTIVNVPSHVSVDEWGKTKTYTVVSILNDAFIFHGDDVEEVILPETIRYIGESAFEKCYRLRSVHLPSSLEFLGRYAFTQTDLRDVVIPDNLREVQAGAFKDCKNLKSVYFGKSVDSFIDAFSGCDNLEEITVDLDNMNLSSYDGVVYTKRYDEPIFCPMGKSSIIISDLATSIPMNFLYDHAKLQHITMGNSVKYIGSEAFAGSGIESIVLPNSVISIYIDAFNDCKYLESISVGCGLSRVEGWTPGIVPSILMTGLLDIENLKEIIFSPEHPAYATYKGCLYDKSYSVLYLCPDKKPDPEIHPSTETIDEYAFDDNDQITHMIIPANVRTILHNAFARCTAMKVLEIEPNDDLRFWDYSINATSLNEIYCKCTMPPATDNAFTCYGSDMLMNFFDSATVYVPRGTSESYRQAWDWYRFKNIVECDFAEIGNISGGTAAEVEGYYDLRGIRSSRPHSGLNIVRYTDGSVSKALF